MYDTICLSGGGIRGIAFIGAIEYLQKYNVKFKKYVGTSVGAFISFALCINYSIKDLKTFIKYFDFSIITKKISLENIINNYIISGNDFDKLFQIMLFRKLKMHNITFKQLYNITNKELFIIATNYTENKEVVFNHIYSPDMDVLLALRMSISIPIVFKPVFFNNCYYVDGGLKNNFPLNYCNTNTTIGMCINYSVNNDINIIKMGLNIINVFINNINNKYINQKNNVIFIKSKFDNKILNVEKNEKKILIKIGFNKAKKFTNNNIYFFCYNLINSIIYNI